MNADTASPDNRQARLNRARDLRSRLPKRRVFNPYFWDRLSDTHLTWSALRELSRRKHIAEFNEKAEAAAQIHARRAEALQGRHRVPRRRRMGDPGLARFARNGGPDLTDLRGLVEMEEQTRRREQDIEGVEVGNTLPKFRAFSADFDQHLTDYQIHTLDSADSDPPANMQDILAMLSANDAPAVGGAREYVHGTETWGDVRVTVFQSHMDETPHSWRTWDGIIPQLIETTWGRDCTRFYTPFSDTEPLTDASIAPPVPEVVDGVPAIMLVPELRYNMALRRIINTNGMHGDIVAPNFFLDEGPETQQSCFEGAYGARAMHELVNLADKIRHEAAFGVGETLEDQYPPHYDNHARTITAVLTRGVLWLYAHHVTAPETPGGRPRYHMTPVGRWVLYQSVATFREGFRALKNARTFARMERQRCIGAANEAAREDSGDDEDDLP